MSASSDRVVPLTAGTHDGHRADAASPPHGNRDWSSSLSLIKRAGETVKAAEDQTHKVISRAEAMLQRANEELEAAHHRIAVAEERMRAAEMRAERAEMLAREAQLTVEQAEARAREAEEWLDRIHRTIVSEFPPGHPATR
jgi:DNA repair ATPase RecN